MDNPKISVIVPVYKVEPYLRRCIDSIVNQTYKNLEIILVDDGSPDNCGAICDEYAARDDRIIAIHKENGGVSSARNVGLDVATGEWIGFIDSDDWIEVDMYEYLMELVYHNQASVAQCGMFVENGTNCEPLFVFDEKLISSKDDAFWKHFANATCNKLYYAVVIKNLCYDSNYPIGEDLLFNLNFLKKSGDAVLGNQAKYHYCQRVDSVCHQPPTERSLLSFRQMLSAALSMFEPYSKQQRYIRELFFRNELDICSKIVRYENPEFENIKRKIRRNLRMETPNILAIKGLSCAERMKLMLIAWSWWLYKMLLLSKKKISTGII